LVIGHEASRSAGEYGLEALTSEDPYEVLCAAAATVAFVMGRAASGSSFGRAIAGLARWRRRRRRTAVKSKAGRTSAAMTPPAIAAVGVDLAVDTGMGRIAEEKEPKRAEAAQSRGVDEPEMAFADDPDGRVDAEEGGALGETEAAPPVTVEPPVEVELLVVVPGDVAGDPGPDAGDVGDPGDEVPDGGFGLTRK